MKNHLLVLFAGFAVVAPARAVDVAPPADQIASSILAAPKERRADATVLGYNDKGAVVTLRKGTNEMVCLADDPSDKTFSVACYHKDLEPFMARGRELAKDVKGKERHEARWKEVDEGKLKMPKEARMLYVLTGSGFDAARDWLWYQLVQQHGMTFTGYTYFNNRSGRTQCNGDVTQADGKVNLIQLR